MVALWSKYPRGAECSGGSVVTLAQGMEFLFACFQGRGDFLLVVSLVEAGDSVGFLREDFLLGEVLFFIRPSDREEATDPAVVQCCEQALRRLFGKKITAPEMAEPVGGEKCIHLLDGIAGTDVAVVGKEFRRVGSADQGIAAGFDHPGDFRGGSAVVRDVFEDLGGDHRVDRGGIHRQLREVSLVAFPVCLSAIIRDQALVIVCEGLDSDDPGAETIGLETDRHFTGSSSGINQGVSEAGFRKLTDELSENPVFDAVADRVSGQAVVSGQTAQRFLEGSHGRGRKNCRCLGAQVG